MDLIKIGEFIKEKRKSKNITQQELAERLSVTDRAVSKRECGKSLPDSGIMLELCEILGISVNELLSGKELEIKEFSKEAESNLIYVVKQKEETDKRLLNVEIGFGIIGTVAFLGMLVFGILGYAYWGLPLWALITMSSLGFVMFIITMLIALRIEQKAGYYECKECGYRYAPTYKQVVFAPHVNRSRYMKCPHCGKRSYHKKVISQKEEHC